MFWLGRKTRWTASHEKIPTATARLVASFGPAELTIEKAAQAASLSKAEVLYHFPTEDALVSALIAASLGRLERKVYPYAVASAGALGSELFGRSLPEASALRCFSIYVAARQFHFGKCMFMAVPYQLALPMFAQICPTFFTPFNLVR